MMSTTTHAGLAMRPSPEIPVSRPRAVYSIDQILGTQSIKSGRFLYFCRGLLEDGFQNSWF